MLRLMRRTPKVVPLRTTQAGLYMAPKGLFKIDIENAQNNDPCKCHSRYKGHGFGNFGGPGKPTCPDPWADPKSRSTLTLYSLHHTWGLMGLSSHL